MKKSFTNYFFVNNIKIYNIEKNRNIIDYLENLNVKIPHYCYHPKLTVSGNCRMCLVELKNSPKPLVSCAMTVTNNLEIYTDSPLVKKARENILEFLLLNHPLDCPVCDQGGECDLQDQSYIFGSTNKRFYNYKRSVINKNLGPIVKTVMTRCIHCTRCVRFAAEVAGISDLGMYGRGYNSEIGTYISKVFDSELSGNVIDICPVGALTNKPYSFVDRNWELTNINSIDCMDSFGENVNISVKNINTITKIYPSYSYQDGTNSWITNKTRFSFDGMFTSERIFDLNVLNSTFNDDITWKNIFKEIIYIIYFQKHLTKLYSFKNTLHIVLGENVNIESLNTLFLLKQTFPFIKLCKLKSNNICSDLEESFTTDNISDYSIDRFTNCLLIGVNTRFESPTLNIKLKKKIQKGGFNIYAINSFLDLLLPYSCLGNSLTNLKQIAEGTHPICQKLKNNPTMIIFNPNLHTNYLVSKYFKTLSKYIKNSFISKNNINIVNKSLTEPTVNYFSGLDCLTLQSFKNSAGLYLINISKKDKFIKKIVNFKLFNYISSNKNNFVSSVLLNQTHFENLSDSFRKKFKISINLPNTSFYEENGSFFNTEGYLRKSIKVVPSKGSSKNNNEILKAFLFYLKKEFLKLEKTTTTKSSPFLNYFMLNFSPLFHFKQANDKITFKKSFLKLNFSNSQVINYNLKKNCLSKPYLWLDDFYIGGKDLYSSFSKIMVECSKLNRKKTSNFINSFQ